MSSYQPSELATSAMYSAPCTNHINIKKKSKTEEII